MAYRSDIVSVRGVRTHVMRGGSGKPVLVLHPEFGAGLWAPFHDQIAVRFRVIAPDHPGFGRSERPEWLDHIDDLVYHYVDLLDLLELPKVSLIGCSLGGWIAAAFAVAHPERVNRMVLAAPAGIKVDGVERYDLFANPLEETLARLFHDSSRVAQILPTDSGPEAIVRAYRESTTFARLAWNPYLYDPKLQQRLVRITAPTLILWGENDTILPPAHGERLAALIASSTLKLLPACGHLAPYEQAEAVSRLALEFLTRPD